MNVLFVEANHDDVTLGVHRARRQLLPPVRIGTSHQVSELYGAQATSTEVFNAWANISGNFGLISGMGHGEANEFLGHNNSTVFENRNPASSACLASIVHLFSCNCGNGLGRQLVSSGARAFIGYNDFVLLPHDPALNHLFIAAAAEIDLAILNGITSAGARQSADSAYKASRALLAASPLATPSDVASLEMNHAALVGPWTHAEFGSF